ncbi:MAG: phosphoglucomutase/phosphomannomutase family protein [Chloroflexota bacterium]|nr:phosphoglucomutase/phosphomannomutase family protein [Chloroflexota bacterium]
MTGQIKFGTDGWRGVIADDFTFENVRLCSQGLANYLYNNGTAERGVVVGYDTRFLSKEFAEATASVLAGSRIKVYLCDHASPTPVVSLNVLYYKAAGAVIITASHNPGIWNGFKFKPEYAGSATQDITDMLEREIDKVDQVKHVSLNDARAMGFVRDIDPDPPYRSSIESIVDLQSIKNAGLHIAVDSMHGSGSGYIHSLISGGSTIVEELRNDVNPTFPGMEQPEPIAHNLLELMDLVISTKLSAGIALDGDADRVGIVSNEGKFVSTLETFALLAFYLLEHKGQRGDLVKGLTSSRMLTSLGAKYGIAVHETKVGFKFIGPMMSETDALMGGEESGGYAFRGHIPERDGILSGLLFLEYMTKTGKTPSNLIRDLFDLVGTHSYSRRDIQFEQSERHTLTNKILNAAGLSQIGGKNIISYDEIDGMRLNFSDAWLAVRFSGTEPLLRIYCEASDDKLVEHILDAMQEYLEV